MSRDQKNICLYCRWWKADTLPCNAKEAHHHTGGECRLAKPSLVQWGSYSEGLNSRTAWPRANGGDFCGEFQERPSDIDPNRDIRPWLHISEAGLDMGDAA